ncbi:hypothetical protein NLJ89_g6794 [Agrocybe chaxingu]|uniref:Uncharacterized protein n=1 Tax=Agrocybe chaxingu TaxID=84603 RepID=A0A9W8K066_9AGAR|nr:hypothetical protein NLJ89_g6794 [Agrocybe chaxingu]
MVLEVSWSGLWADNKVKRTLKVGVFNEVTIGHLLKLYERAQPEDGNEEHIPADLVHHFLLAICTRPSIGICFRDRGWYPREADVDEGGGKEDEQEEGRKRTGRIHNKILANVLKTLRVNEDARQQELALKILLGSPELVSGYWSAVALTLEPRLSSKWITNIAFFGNVISLPVPSSSFLLPASTSSNLYNPSPPPLSSILENVLPSVGTKHNFSKGLQSPSKLVQHCTALALARCLLKYKKVKEAWDQVRTALGEDDGPASEGLWTKRWKEVEREVRRRVPEVQVVLSFQFAAQQGMKDGKEAATDETQNALLVESSQRVLWLYHRCLPALVMEARFEVGKLLGTFTKSRSTKDNHVDDQETDREIEESPAARLYRVQQLHVLRLLRDSEQFVWSGKVGTSPLLTISISLVHGLFIYLASLQNTPIHILLSAFCSTPTPAIRRALGDVLKHVLSQSIIFQEDPAEPDLWLKSLPRYSLGAGADGVDSVTTFLDECLQRCMKTPYRYIEVLHSFASSHAPEDTEDAASSTLNQLDTYPSPLLMTILEQLEAKVNNNSLSSSAVLGILTFLKQLLFHLTSKTPDLRYLKAFAGKLEGALGEKRSDGKVKREMDMIHRILAFEFADVNVDMDAASLEAEHWLEEMEKTGIPETKASRTAAALQVIDWLRTVDHSLEAEHLKRLVSLVTSLDPTILPLLIMNLIPGQADLWFAMDIMSPFSEIRPHLQFEWLYIHTSSRRITDEKYRAVLSHACLSRCSSAVDLIRVVHLIIHGVASTIQDSSLVAGHLALLADVVKFASTGLSPADFIALKETVFVKPNIFKDIFTSPISQEVVKAVDYLLGTALDPSKSDDRKVVSEISNHWFNLLKSELHIQHQSTVSAACLWIKYLEPHQLFEFMDYLQENGHTTPAAELANVILEALSSMAAFELEAESALVHRLPHLLSLRPLLPDSPLLDDLIATSLEATLPIGLDGFSPPNASSDLVVMVKRSQTRWAHRSRAAKVDLDIRQFLTQTTFSEATVRIISALLYCRPVSREIFAQWAASEDCLRRDINLLLPIIHAFLDSAPTGQTVKYEIWAPLLPRILDVLVDKGGLSALKNKAKQCLSDILMTASEPEAEKILSALVAEFKEFSKADVSAEVLSTGVWLADHYGSKAKALLTIIVDNGMQWAIDRLADEKEIEGSTCVAQWLTLLVKKTNVSKSHLAETLLSVVVQNHLHNVPALHLATECLSSSQIKPVAVNKHLQSIIQHAHFFKICVSTLAEGLKAREAVVELLHRLFHLHPANTCQITHIEPIIKIYCGTLSSTDLRILSIFQLFEGQRRLSVTPLLSRWSATPGISSQTALEALQSLDPILVLRTTLQFPRWRRVDDRPGVKLPADGQDIVLYDPIFIMLLFSQMLSEQPPSSAFAWIELFRTNIVSLFIRALSAKDGRVRELALCQIVALWKHLETADLHEKPHVRYILNLMKDLMPPTSNRSESSESQYPRRLPTYTSLLLMHAFRGVFYPSNSIYPLTARFLLQRPTLDTSDVPMLYSMLYSSSDDNWKKERMWMIKFLADGMVGSEDWKVLKRRHTWDLLASLFQSAGNDGALRLAILGVLANVTCNAQATTSLLLKSALLPWIEMQLLYSASSSNTNANAEGLAWIKILENILVVVDSDKIEAATNGEWRTVICRCLLFLLDEKHLSSTTDNFVHAVPVILRLASLTGPALHDLPTLLYLAVCCLQKFENDVHFHSPGLEALQQANPLVPPPPHRASSIHQRAAVDSKYSLVLWGYLVETLWRATMRLDRHASAWDALTPRMLLWSSGSGAQAAENFGVAQWAFPLVLRHLRPHTRDSFMAEINFLTNATDPVLKDTNVQLGHISNHYHARTPAKGLDHLREESAPSACVDSNARYDAPSPAGSGKSALAKTIAELCMTKNSIIATFFFTRTRADRVTDGDLLIPTLSCQLIEKMRLPRTAIQKYLLKDRGIFNKTRELQMQELIINPLNWYFSRLEYHYKCLVQQAPLRLIVIDGLDECVGKEVQRDLLRVLGKAVTTLRLPIRFLIASRPEIQIRQLMEDREVFRTDCLTSLDLGKDPNTAKDIQSYLETQFAKIRHTHIIRASIPPTWPSPGDIMTLVVRASGQFIFASTVVGYTSSSNHNPMERLAIIIKRLPPPGNDNPYSQLDLLYGIIFSSAEKLRVDIQKVLRIFGILIIPRLEGTTDDLYSAYDGIGRILDLAPESIVLLLSEFVSLVELPPLKSKCPI